MENVIVIGASANEERYSNKAMKMLAEHGHNPIPVAPAVETILGRKVYAKATDAPGKIDTVRCMSARRGRKGWLNRSWHSNPGASFSTPARKIRPPMIS